MRLIDAEKELKELKNMKVEGEVFTTAVNFAIKVIDDAPTIEPCEDAISREAVKEEIRKPTWKIANKRELIAMINFIPSVAPSRPQGEWIDSDGDTCCCSNCGTEAPIDGWEYKYRDKIRLERTNYCPNCGARMKGEE